MLTVVGVLTVGKTTEAIPGLVQFEPPPPVFGVATPALSASMPPPPQLVSGVIDERPAPDQQNVLVVQPVVAE